MQGARRFCFGLVLLSACGKTSTSSLKHDMDSGLRSTGRWSWVDVSPDERESVLFPFIQASSGSQDFQTVNADHPTVARLQAWVDKLDQNLRDMPGFSNVPAPKVVIKQDESPNAFVTPVPTCLDVPVYVEGSGDAEETVPGVAFLSPYGGVSYIPDLSSCVHRSLAEEEVPAFLDWLNKDTSLCQMTYEKEKAAFFVAEGDCKIHPSLSIIGKVSTLGYLSSSNQVIVHSSLIEKFEEEPLVTVLAHELAHYYRAHAASKMEEPEFDFFYSMGEKNKDHRPHPIPVLQNLAKSLLGSTRQTSIIFEQRDKKSRASFCYRLSFLQALL